MNAPPTKFRPCCPKCSGFNITIERLGASGYNADEWFDKVLICVTCGKRVYGKAIQTELTRQERSFRTDQQADLKEKQKAAQKARREARERAEEEARQAEQAEAIRQAEEAARRALKPDGTCAWQECTEPPSDRSIYCSRGCSNKNARWRHQQKQAAARK